MVAMLLCGPMVLAVGPPPMPDMEECNHFPGVAYEDGKGGKQKIPVWALVGAPSKSYYEAHSGDYAQEFAAIQARLAELNTLFAQNLLHDENAFTLPLPDEA